MLGWIHSSPDKCMASPCTREKNPLPHHCPFPSAQAPQGPAVGGCNSWGSPLPSTAAAQAASPPANQRRHPSERWSAPGDARQEETCGIPPWARARCIPVALGPSAGASKFFVTLYTTICELLAFLLHYAERLTTSCLPPVIHHLIAQPLKSLNISCLNCGNVAM